MTYKELLAQLVATEGPCLRLCSYCPEEFNTAEVKECVEDLVKTIYQLKQDIDQLQIENNFLRDFYKETTGSEYKNA